MELLLRQLVKALTAIVVTLSVGHVAPIIAGGTTVQKTPASITGRELFDTPSGQFDTGFFIVRGSETIAHLPPQTTATSSLPDGFYPAKDTTGLTETHVIGTQYVFYDDAGKPIGTSVDQTIATKLRTPGQSLPTISVVE